MTRTASAIARYLKTIFLRATHMFRVVAFVMAPVMLLVYLADRLGVVAWVGRVLAPAMALLDLPPDAGIIWATTALSGMYAGIGALATLSGGLHLTVAQMSALAAMMLFAHNLPTEQAIVRRAGASALITGGLRVAAALSYGAGVAWVCKLGGWLQQPVSFAWLSARSAAEAGTPDFLPWLLATGRALLMIWAIICVLVVVLDAFERSGITHWLTRLLSPVLRASGVDERAAPMTTAGMLVGLTYGGALVIDATSRERYSRRTLLLALCWLALFHSLLEDTLLVVALGADLWIILVLRGAVTLAIMAALAALTGPRTRWGRRLRDSEEGSACMTKAERTV